MRIWDNNTLGIIVSDADAWTVLLKQNKCLQYRFDNT